MKITKKQFSVEWIAILLMCLYTLMTSLVYIDKSLEAVNSLILYAFLGMAIVTMFFRWKIRFNKYWVWYLGFLLISLMSALYAPNSASSLRSVYSVMVCFGLIFAMCIVMTNLKRMELFMNSLVIGTVILIIYLIATGQTNIDSEAGERLGTELTGNANVFACLYMVAACSSVYFLISKPKIWQKAIYLVPLALQMYALVLSGGRKYPLVPLLVLFLILPYKTDKKGKKHVILYSIIGIAAMLVIYQLIINVPFLYENIGYRFESLIEYTLGISQSTDASTAERELMRQKAFELWMESPVFGQGFNAFSQIGGFQLYSHCNYLEILCNQGIIGFIYYYGFWAYLLFRIYSVKNNSLMRLFLGAMLIGLMIYDYGAISYNTPLTHFFALMASVYSESPSEKSSSANELKKK